MLLRRSESCCIPSAGSISGLATSPSVSIISILRAGSGGALRDGLGAILFVSGDLPRALLNRKYVREAINSLTVERKMGVEVQCTRCGRSR